MLVRDNWTLVTSCCHLIWISLQKPILNCMTGVSIHWFHQWLYTWAIWLLAICLYFPTEPLLPLTPVTTSDSHLFSYFTSESSWEWEGDGYSAPSRWLHGSSTWEKNLWSCQAPVLGITGGERSSKARNKVGHKISHEENKEEKTAGCLLDRVQRTQKGWRCMGENSKVSLDILKMDLS